jgi:hypothetical protein
MKRLSHDAPGAALGLAVPLTATLALTMITCVLPVPARAQTSRTGGPSNAVYVAHLHAMNTTVTRLQTTGEARFTVTGDSLMINITVKGAPPGVTHWQHFHGFTDNHDAVCPTQAADVNRDGIIDLMETTPMSGTTMVPFISDPVSMQVAQGTYPKASAAGTYEYHSVVSLKALDTAFGKAFGGAPLALDRRVVFIHGIAATASLPTSVASLGTIPAQVTLPIACGKIERVTR